VPAFVGPFVAFALGVALALQTRRELERFEDSERKAARTIAALYGALVVAPACAYFLVFAGDWSVAYLVDTRSVPSAADLALVALDAALVPVGFASASLAIRKRARRTLFLLGFLPSLCGLGLALAFSPELGVEGTTFQVRNHFGTRPLAGSPLGLAVLGMNAVVLAGLAFAVRAVQTQPEPTARPAPPPKPPSEPPPRPLRLLGRG
jgi:hypothetical protein